MLSRLASTLTLTVAGIAIAVTAPASARAPEKGWPHTVSDIKPDPGVLFGVLENGMRYAIMRNTTPKGQAAFRLRVGSGALQESDAQQGLAHFVEHMAFKGSKNVPEGEMLRILQRKGLEFGPDTNAATDYDQTVYQFDLREVDDDTIDTGLKLMRETASELSFDPAAFDKERGVVLSEERVRDTPDYRAGVALSAFLLGDMRARDRLPIGKVDVVAKAPVGLAVDYYRANYRPENALLAIVGDVDPATIERKIKARFSDWKGQGPAQPAIDTGTVARRGPTVNIVEVPEFGTELRIAFVRAPDRDNDSYAKTGRQWMRALASLILNRRLDRIASAKDAPFTSAAIATGPMADSIDVSLLTVKARPENWEKALAAVVAEQRRLAQYGVSQDELDREIKTQLATLQNGVDSAATRQNSVLVNSLVNNFNANGVFSHPDTDIDIFRRTTGGMKAADLKVAIDALFAGSGPLVQLATAKAPVGGEAALKSALDAALAAPVSPPQAATAVTWPYSSFGVAGTAVARDEVADFGVTRVRFANGVRLIVKPTKFTDKQIYVGVSLGVGYLGLPPDRPNASWSSGAYIAGGLEAISLQDVNQAFQGIVASASMSMNETTFQFFGETRPQDMQAQFQLMAAYVSAPGYRPEAFEAQRTRYLEYLDQVAATPESVISTEVGSLLRSGDARWRIPTRQALEAAMPDDLRALMAPAMHAGPLDVTVIGDVDVEETIRQVAATLGALPARQPAVVDPASRVLRFPDAPATPVALFHKGRSDKAGALVAWRGPGFRDDRRASRALILAGDVIQNRLTDKLRSADGATYSPQSSVDLSTVFPHFGYAFTYVETQPAKVQAVFDAVESIVADIKANGITQDELVRVRTPRVEQNRTQMQTNSFWYQSLIVAHDDPGQFDDLRTRLTDYETMTADEVRKAAVAYLAATPLRVTIKPEAEAKF